MNYFDIHSHINFPQYDEDRNDVLLRMKEEGVGTITVGTNSRTSQEAVELAKEHENLYACIGVHPVDEEEKEFNAEVFEELVKEEKVVAVGEIGLDYFHAKDKDRQEKLFRDQIEFAIKHNLPVMIHCRDAYEDVLDILEEYKGRVSGNMHFFAGDKEIAQRVLSLGFTISFTGVVTFAKEYEDLVKFVPLESMMAETDAPFVAPAPKRGRRNEPTYVKYVYEKIAEIREEDPEHVREVLSSNARGMFGLD